jgi:hypothetical protein
MYLGDYPVDGVVYFSFSSQKADGTPVALTNGAVVVRKNATAAAMTLDPAPVLVADFNTITGLNNVTVDLADADFVAGDYDVCLSAGTVDSVSVIGRVLAHFSIANRFDSPWTAAKAAFVDASIAAIPTTPMRGTDSAALAATALDNTVWTDAKAAFVDSSLSAMKTVVDGIPTTPMRGTDSAVLASSLGAKGGLPILDAATGLVLTGFGAGAVKGNANVTEIGGDTQSATDLKDFADAGYDPSTNKVTEVAALTGFTQLIQRDAPPTAAEIATEVAAIPIAYVDNHADHLVSVLSELQQRFTGKVIFNRTAGTIVVYDTDLTTVLCTLTMTTDGAVDTVLRT